MSEAHLFAIGVLLAWLAGIRVYLTVFGVGLAGFFGWLDLPAALEVTASPWVLGVSGVLAVAEFFADKIPGVDSVWDLLQSVIRIPAGAALAAGVFGADSATMATMAALMGGSLALSSQVAKSTTRAAINTSPEPFSNVGASLVEDGASVGAIWLALTHPLAFAAVLLVVVIALWLLTWALWRFLKAVVQRLRALFGGSPAMNQKP